MVGNKLHCFTFSEIPKCLILVKFSQFRISALPAKEQSSWSPSRQDAGQQQDCGRGLEPALSAHLPPRDGLCALLCPSGWVSVIHSPRRLLWPSASGELGLNTLIHPSVTCEFGLCCLVFFFGNMKSQKKKKRRKCKAVACSCEQQHHCTCVFLPPSHLWAFILSPVFSWAGLGDCKDGSSSP